MMMPNTAVSIIASGFLVNGRRTYEGRVYKGLRVEGLLFNSRMVQAIFDDLNPATCRLERRVLSQCIQPSRGEA
jgi:hypothetical protein